MIAPREARRLPLSALACAILAGCPAMANAAEDRPAEAASRPVRRSHLEAVADIAKQTTTGELGLRLTRASAVLRQQLALDRGAGLVVDAVTPGSRADRAGLRQHDVLVMLDDQLLILPDQLQALIDAAPARPPLQCTVIRAGRRISVSLDATAATAGVAAVPAKAAVPGLRPTPPARAIAGPRPADPQPAARTPPGPVVQISHETLLRQDPDYQIRLTGGDETRLVVTDPHGRVLFKDSIDTPDRRSRMPVAIRGRVEEMERMLERQPVEVGRLDTAPIDIR